MTKYVAKTQPSPRSVSAFIATIEDPVRRADAKKLEGDAGGQRLEGEDVGSFHRRLRRLSLHL